MKEIKSNPSKIIKVYIENSKTEIIITTTKETKQLRLTEISIMDRYSNGSYIVKDRIINTHLLVNSLTEEQEDSSEPSVSKSTNNLKEIDDRIMTIDDLLNNIENNK